jgi:FlaG/FlaF family flagellin (archaellin)
MLKIANNFRTLLKRGKMRKDKKALSALVATVLLVLITVAVVGLIWGSIIPMIKQGMEEASGKSECLKTEISIKAEGTSYSASGLKVNIERGSESTANITKILIKATDSAGATQTWAYTNVPSIFGNIIYQNQTAIPNTTKIVKVDAVPVIKVGTTDYPCASTGAFILP